MQRKMKVRPLYRQIIREALSGAWREKRLWIIALFAGIIQTGGIYDVLARKAHLTMQQAASFFSQWDGSLIARFRQLPGIDQATLIQSILFSAVIILAILAFAILAQGALVYALDRHLNGKGAMLREAFQRAAHQFVPLVVLNFISLGAIWISRFLLSAPLAEVLRAPSLPVIALYIFTLFLFLLAVVFFTSLHLLALNGMMTDELTLSESLSHAFKLFREAWITVLETAFLMLILGSLIFFGSIALSFVINLPFLFFMRASLYVSLPQIYFLTNVVSGMVLLAAFLFGGSYAVTFQYATWNRLYRRINEGTARAKVHRVFNWLTGARHSSTER